MGFERVHDRDLVAVSGPPRSAFIQAEFKPGPNPPNTFPTLLRVAYLQLNVRVWTQYFLQTSGPLLTRD